MPKTRTKGRSCTGKTRHATRDAAEAHRRSLIAGGAYPEQIQIYPCGFCAGYHTGHKGKEAAVTDVMTVTQKEYLACQYAIKLGPWLRFAVDQRDAEQVEELIGGLDRQQLMVLAVVLAAEGPAPASRPDDGLIDEVAVGRVLDGQSVPLSPLEQSVAAREMKRRGWERGEILAALRVSRRRYETLLAMPEQPSLFDGGLREAS